MLLSPWFVSAGFLSFFFPYGDWTQTWACPASSLLLSCSPSPLLFPFSCLLIWPQGLSHLPLFSAGTADTLMGLGPASSCGPKDSTQASCLPFIDWAVPTTSNGCTFPGRNLSSPFQSLSCAQSSPVRICLSSVEPLRSSVLCHSLLEFFCAGP